MNFGLKEEIIDKINAVFAAFCQIDEVIIYGSRAKGNYRNGSDLDLTIKGSELNLHVLNSVSLKLDDLLLPYTFDLSIYKQISNPDLIEHIKRVGKIFYQKKLYK
ncbi:nucleotidyltransferase domain-containing protein [Rubrolithibacter danxiaensis]|uniref:nucleotidyltransferase domain-containing protein n=1 Tax=Rubrolithibacter danxiaensis TaxID=3390805 RepID=UPI003BF7B83B